MNSAELVQLIEKEAQSLISRVLAELKTNLGTSHYRRWKDEELYKRGYTVYHHLGEWLVSKDESAIEKAGDELGKHRFAEGIPLGQVILALILEEKHFLKHLEGLGVRLEANLQEAITAFFQKTIYYTALGYETSLAQSNRLAGRAAVSPRETQPVPQAAARSEMKEEETEMEISRSGQVGEFGG